MVRITAYTTQAAVMTVLSFLFACLFLFLSLSLFIFICNSRSGTPSDAEENVRYSFSFYRLLSNHYAQSMIERECIS